MLEESDVAQANAQKRVKPLRIVVLGAYYSPELIGIGKYSGEMTRWLRDAGHEVHMIAAPPHYPGWRVHPPYRALQFKREEMPRPDDVGSPSDRPIGSLTVWRCPIFEPDPPSGARRLIYQISLALSSLPVMLRLTFRRPHVVIVVTPPLLTATVTRLWAWLCGAKAWLHIQDLEVDAAFDLGLLKGARLRAFALWCERQLMARFNRVSTISSKMRERVLDKGIQERRVRMLENWVDLDIVKPMPADTAYRNELQLPDDCKVVLYSGNLGAKQGLDILVDAAIALRERSDICFLIVGEGPAKAGLMERAVGLKNVRFLTLQPFERLNELLATAAIHALPQLAAAADLVMPSKLGGMLASGRAIVAAADVDSQVGQIVREAGLVVPPEVTSSFVDAVERLADDDTLRLTLGRRARALAEERLAIDRILEAFESELYELSK